MPALDLGIGTSEADQPCTDWATSADVCGDCEEVDATTLASMLTVASQFLYAKSGRQWPGVCTDTVRPCRVPCSGGAVPWGGGGMTVISGGSSTLAPLLSCGCGGDPYRGMCGCGPVAEIALPLVPVVAITSVKVDGAVVSAADYRVDDDRWLVRTDGDDWPSCQTMESEPTESGTFEVTYTYGANPPQSGVLAAATLACELALACTGSDACRLPKRVSTITREGVTMALLDDLALYDNGRVGLPEVDLFLAWANPGNVIRPPAVYSPHRGPGARRATA